MQYFHMVSYPIEYWRTDRNLSFPWVIANLLPQNITVTQDIIRRSFKEDDFCRCMKRYDLDIAVNLPERAYRSNCDYIGQFYCDNPGELNTYDEWCYVIKVNDAVTAQHLAVRCMSIHSGDAQFEDIRRCVLYENSTLPVDQLKFRDLTEDEREQACLAEVRANISIWDNQVSGIEYERYRLSALLQCSSREILLKQMHDSGFDQKYTIQFMGFDEYLLFLYKWKRGYSYEEFANKMHSPVKDILLVEIPSLHLARCVDRKSWIRKYLTERGVELPPVT